MAALFLWLYWYISKTLSQPHCQCCADLPHLVWWYIFLLDILPIYPYVILNHGTTSLDL